MAGMQTFKGARIQTMRALLDLRANCEKTLEYAAEVFRNNTADNGHFQFYPRKARMKDF